MKIAVTGAFSYSGKYITRRLLRRGEQVTTLTGHPDRANPFDQPVEVLPLDFSDQRRLVNSLSSAQVLINTYWIRFDHGRNTQARAVENTRRLIEAASTAGVRRVIHISITNPSLTSPLPYFSGKADNEQAVLDSGLSYAILRPTVLFGTEDILINNVAFLLRRFPIFMIAGDGSYRLQPVYVDDLAAMVEDAVYRKDSYVNDAVGSEVLSFRALVQLIGAAINCRRLLISVHPRLVLLAARALGRFFGDVLLTPQEINGLMANLLVSSEPPRGATRLSEWLHQNKHSVGLKYASELKRHYV
jgi:NADH dehydrogenase